MFFNETFRKKETSLPGLTKVPSDPPQKKQSSYHYSINKPPGKIKHQCLKTGTVKRKSNKGEETSDAGQDKVQWRDESAALNIMDTGKLMLEPVLIVLEMHDGSL